jgi:hypothetical protein
MLVAVSVFPLQAIARDAMNYGAWCRRCLLDDVSFSGLEFVAAYEYNDRLATAGPVQKEIGRLLIRKISTLTRFALTQVPSIYLLTI